MEFITGRIFHRVDLPEITNRDERKAIFKSAVDVLSQLHSLQPSEIGLGDYGSTQDFYDRQIRSLDKISSSQAVVIHQNTGICVGEIHLKDELLDWYKARKPQHQITIVHGDFKLDNLVSRILDFHDLLHFLGLYLFCCRSLSEQPSRL